MSITITVNNVWSKISGIQDVQLVDNIDKITSYFVEGYQYTKAFRDGYYDRKTGRPVHWDGKRHLLSSSKMVFSTGLLERITKFLESRNVSYVIDDRRPFVPQGEELEIKHYTPREYQKMALEAVVAANGRGIIRVGTGGGKTLIAGMIVAKYNVKSFIYVVGKTLLHQFYKEIKKMLGDSVPVGIIGDGLCDIKPQINICSIWTAITAFDLKTKVSLDDEDWDPEIIEIGANEKRALKAAIEKSNLAIFDEAHFLATDTLQSIYKASKNCKYFIALTGTPWRDDNADLLLESACGKKIYDMSASKLISMGYLVAPKITFFNTPPMAETVMSSNYASIYSKYIVKNDIRNGIIVDAAKKLISYGRKVLILVRFLNHGRILAEMLSGIPLFFVNGEIDGETREEVKTAFENGELKCLLASSVYDLGVDIPTLDSIILAGSGRSTVRCLQRIGRVIRTAPGKFDALVVDFLDSARYLDKHSAIRLTVYETEPAFKIKFPKGFDPASIKRVKKVNEKVS